MFCQGTNTTWPELVAAAAATGASQRPISGLHVVFDGQQCRVSPEHLLAYMEADAGCNKHLAMTSQEHKWARSYPGGVHEPREGREFICLESEGGCFSQKL